MLHNQQLKREREQRGWSQERVADELGTNKHTISRWERGIAFPYPYYREKLSALFSKSAEELGLIPQNDNKQLEPKLPESIDKYETFMQNFQMSLHLPPVSSLQRETIDQTEIIQKISSETTHSNTLTGSFPLIDPFLPFSRLEVNHLVGRETVLDYLILRLCSPQHPGTSAVSGLPGVGKTALVTALAYDTRIRSYFCDGILWAGVGPQAQITEHLSHWGHLLGLSLAETKYIRNPYEQTQLLRGLIGQRRLLIILDDIWQTENALLLQIGGPNCRYLITTRFPLIAVQVASPYETLALTELSDQASLSLLALLVPGIVEQEEAAAHTLVRRVGTLPLALVLLGKYLQTQSYSQQPRRIQQALHSLNKAEQRIRLEMPLISLQDTSSLRCHSSYSLYASIALSDHHLSAVTQKALRTLSVFPAKPASFSEEAAAALLQEDLEMLDILCDAGLLESCGNGRYMLHQVIADYARLDRTNGQAEDRLVQFGVGYLFDHGKDYQLLEQESPILFAALDAAHRLKHAKAFIQGVRTFLPYIQARGLYSMIAPYVEWALKTARAENDEDAILLFLYHLGMIYEKNGSDEKAERYFTESLLVADRRNSPVQAEVLLSLGYLQMKRGQYDCAQTSFEKVLHLANKGAIKEEPSLLPALTGLGMLTLKQDQFAQIWDYTQQGKRLLLTGNYPGQKSEVLCLIGMICLIHDDSDKTQKIVEHRLQEARQFEYRALMRSVLRHLGVLSYRRGVLATSRILS